MGVKNTINMSKLDSVKEILIDLEILFRCETIGKVRGMGMNDFYESIGDKYYDIRKLTCDKFVILEQMIRNDDINNNDILVSPKFLTGKVPNNWKLELKIGDE